eukprot:scaffold14013_cov81-Skeletonema_dohrnii-CCMP3373.AAC.2
MACGPQRTAAHGMSVTALHLLLLHFILAHFILALIVLLSTVAFALMTCFCISVEAGVSVRLMAARHQNKAGWTVTKKAWHIWDWGD